jgi:hypothetical protein
LRAGIDSSRRSPASDSRDDPEHHDDNGTYRLGPLRVARVAACLIATCQKRSGACCIATCRRWTTWRCCWRSVPFRSAATYPRSSWRRGAAFALLVVQRIVLAITVGGRADPGIYYLIRLVAFLLILVAIVDKNRRADA